MFHHQDDQPESGMTGQLVVYSPPLILKPLQEKEKRLVFGGQEWVIQQNWDSVGVAAVIWEPVRTSNFNPSLRMTAPYSPSPHPPSLTLPLSLPLFPPLLSSLPMY